MKDFINNLNAEALERLIPIINSTCFDTEFVWGFGQTFYAEDGTSVEFNAWGTGSYLITFNTENARMSFRIPKREYLALRYICERNTDETINYDK